MLKLPYVLESSKQVKEAIQTPPSGVLRYQFVKFPPFFIPPGSSLLLNLCFTSIKPFLEFLYLYKYSMSEFHSVGI